MSTKRIYLSCPTMHGEELEYVHEAFDTNWVAPLGPNVNEFEKEVAAYVGGGYASALSSGTAAIHLALIIAGVKRDDIVFAQSLTFSATVNPAVYLGAKPVFIDSEKESWNMDPEALEKAFEKYPKCRCVIAVNLYGTPARLDRIKEICTRHGAVLIEDAAESLGSKYDGKHTGTFGDYGIFSFNGNKIITTSGGGMLYCRDEEPIKKSRFLATQAREPERHYEHKEIGYNYRMSNVVAGIGRGQLKHLDEHVSLKRDIYMQYRDAFADLKEVRMNPYPAVSEPNFWLSCMTIDEQSAVKPIDIMLALEKENIETRPIWKPMHMQPVFSDCDLISVSDELVSEDIFARGLCLPSDIKNTAEDMDKIISMVRSAFRA